MRCKMPRHSRQASRDEIVQALSLLSFTGGQRSRYNLYAWRERAWKSRLHFVYVYLCCFALFVCLTLLASFFHLSFKNMYIQYLTSPQPVCSVLHRGLRRQGALRLTNVLPIVRYAFNSVHYALALFFRSSSMRCLRRAFDLTTQQFPLY